MLVIVERSRRRAEGPTAVVEAGGGREEDGRTNELDSGRHRRSRVRMTARARGTGVATEVGETKADRPVGYGDGARTMSERTEGAERVELDGREVWFSTARGFRLGVAGLPDDRGRLEARGEFVRFTGRRVEFALERPARLRLVYEPPGLVPLGGVALMALALVLAGVPPPTVLLALALVALLLGAHSLAARWVRLEQLDTDGGTTIGYLTAAGSGRYTRAPRELRAALERRLPSAERAL